jgi:hypothetical protein
MKRLTFLLLITYILTEVPFGNIVGYEINSKYCKGGKLECGKCVCPAKQVGVDGVCRDIVSCPSDQVNFGNECLKECPSGTIRNGTLCTCPLTKIILNKKCSAIPKSSTIFSRKIVKKPVIYLYPEEPMDASVKLNIKNSKFTAVYPKFNAKNTWNVHAEPDGNILLKGKSYPYLFWEAESYGEQETNEGFIVSDEEAEKFLEEKLDILGLNEKEKTDFITFWLPVLLRNKLSLCKFENKKFFDNFELDVTPKPDSLIRVFLTIKKIDAPVNIIEQKLKSVERKGFTVIEWGGSNL